MKTYFGTVLVLKKLNKAYRALTHQLMCECFLGSTSNKVDETIYLTV